MKVNQFKVAGATLMLVACVLFGAAAASAQTPVGSATITASATCEGVVSGSISWTSSGTGFTASGVRLFYGIDGSSDFSEKVIPSDGTVPGSVGYSVSGFSPGDVVRVTTAVTIGNGVDEYELNDTKTTTVPECPPATKTIDFKSIDQQCPDNGIEKQAHFVITQIGNDAPSSISVSFTDGSSVNASLSDVTGGTAHYYASVPSGALVESAHAVVPYAWSGQANLSHYVCEAPPTTSSSTTSSTTSTTSTTTSTTVPPSSSTTSSTTSTTAPPSSSSTTSSTTSTTSTTQPPSPTTTLPGGTLPSTGGGDTSGGFTVAALLLLLAGGGLILVTRRQPAS